MKKEIEEILKDIGTPYKQMYTVKLQALIDRVVRETERKYCKFIGVETTDGSMWCETHDKFEKLTDSEK